MPYQLHRYFVFLSLLSSSFALSLEDFKKIPFTIHLQEPEYKEGIIFTDKGGILEADGFRLQAEEITYTKKTEDKGIVHTVHAKGSLLLDYEGQIFVGDELFYDFETKSGTLLNGKTAIDVFFISGEKVSFYADKSFSVENASVTTSADASDIVFAMTAEKVHLTHEEYLSTKNIKFKFLNFPVFWIPSFKTDLKHFGDSPIRYSVTWDTGQGPKFSMRYRVYSFNNFNIFLRADYLYARGPGGALELDYKSEDKRTIFQSKNYIANDTFYNDDNPNKKMKRFRLQGIYKTHSKDNKAEVELVYDRISDKNMPGDFKSDNFELNTAKQNRFLTRYFSDYYLAGFNVEPRINSFQGFKQELPSLKIAARPLKLGPTPLILENRLQIEYLDYVYSNEIQNVPKSVALALRDFHSVRAETNQELYLPLHFGPLHFTPKAGFIGILYNNNPEDRSAGQAVFTYGGKLQTSSFKNYPSFKHVINPYATYTGYSKPTQDSEHVYIFDINDGYHRLNLLEIGMQNDFYKIPSFSSHLTITPYLLAFFGDQTFHTLIPKAGIHFSYDNSICKVEGHGRWNFNNDVLDIGNVSFDYTVNANIALALEFRHRSKYDFRKDDHDSFILDVTRSISSLVHSPLSDGRNTFLARAEIKIAPKWTCNIQGHIGWGRKNQPGYTEAKVDIFTMISSAWRLRLTYMHTTRADEVSFGLDLMKM